MHGVKRNENVSEAAQVEAEDLQRIGEYTRIVKEFNAAVERQEGVLPASSGLLSINPEYYTAWNERKRAIQQLEQLSEEFFQEELMLNVAAIKVNPKSYVTWEHRRWFLRNYCTEPRVKAKLVQQELVLLEKLLKLDNRNFHGWNYRIWLAEWAQLSVPDEFDFTTRKIYENFSNYSAWHRRTLLFVPFVRTLTNEQDVTELLRNEVEMCRNAAWTEPADQSVWFYQRWLFFGLPKQLPNHAQLLQELAQEQLKSIISLIAEEPNAILAMSFAVSMGKQEFLPRLAELDTLRQSYWKNKKIN